MTPEDFPQFPDPRVREVMAAAANLVAKMAVKTIIVPIVAEEFEALTQALFAAQHSMPKEPSLPTPCVCCGFSPDLSRRMIQHVAESVHRYLGNAELQAEPFIGCPGCSFDMSKCRCSKPKEWPCPTKPGKTCTATKCEWGCKT